MEVCFSNEGNKYQPGELRVWKCSEPNPVGRYAYFYLTDDQYLQGYELEVFGIKVKDIPYIPLKSASSNTEEGKFSRSSLAAQKPVKIIDKNFANFSPTADNEMCISVIDEIETVVSVELSGYYFVKQILIVRTENDGKLYIFLGYFIMRF